MILEGFSTNSYLIVFDYSQLMLYSQLSNRSCLWALDVSIGYDLLPTKLIAKIWETQPYHYDEVLHGKIEGQVIRQVVNKPTITNRQMV